MEEVVAEIEARHDEDIERMLRRFKRQVKNENIIQIVRDKESYEKPSEKKKKLKRQRDRDNRKRQTAEEW